MHMCNILWQPPVWSDVASRPHRRSGRNQRRRWDLGIIDADTINRKSLYNPYLSVGQIKTYEMECVGAGLEFGTGELQSGVCNLRSFYRQFDFDIGVSCGFRTDLILVKYQQNGDVHGFPVTQKYLIDHGATK